MRRRDSLAFRIRRLPVWARFALALAWTASACAFFVACLFLFDSLFGLTGLTAR